jgi:hypothetical protein
MVAVILHAKASLNGFGEARRGPAVIKETMRFRAFPEDLDYPSELFLS